MRQNSNHYGFSTLDKGWLLIKKRVEGQQEAALWTLRIIKASRSDFVFFLPGLGGLPRHTPVLERVFGMKSLLPNIYLVMRPPSHEFAEKCCEAMMAYQDFTCWYCGGVDRDSVSLIEKAEIADDNVSDFWVWDNRGKFDFLWDCNLDNPDVALTSHKPDEFDIWIDLFRG